MKTLQSLVFASLAASIAACSIQADSVGTDEAAVGTDEAAVGTDQAALAAVASEYGIMHPDSATLAKWAAQSASAPLPRVLATRAVDRLTAAATAATSVNLSSLMSYPAIKRAQGTCGNCWAFSGMGLIEIAMATKGVRSALSVQYVNSGWPTPDAPAACNGGNHWDLVDWYQSETPGGRFLVPLSNTNAAFVDGTHSSTAGTNMPFSNISLTPELPFASMVVGTVPTHSVGQAQAIANIKAILQQNQPVGMNLMLPTKDAWDAFKSYWSNQNGGALWSPDSYNGAAWGSGGGGHGLIVVGYDDSSDHAWLVLNSWGTMRNRPDGIFKMPQAMNYGCSYSNGYFAMSFDTIDVSASHGFMIKSDTNSALAVNAWGGAQNGTVLKLTSACTINNPDCTWTYQNGMIVSDRNPSLAINAYGGAQDGTVLKLVDNCTVTNPDCTWTYSHGVFRSDRNPALGINAYGGAQEQTVLKLYNNCPAGNPDCTWSISNVMLSSARNTKFNVNAYGGAANGVALKLHDGCTVDNPDCTWSFHQGMIRSDRDATLAMNAWGARDYALIEIGDACTLDNPDCTWTWSHGELFSDTSSTSPINAYGGARFGADLLLNSACDPGNPDCLFQALVGR